MAGINKSEPKAPPANGKQSEWAERAGIPPEVEQEIKLYSASGWTKEPLTAVQCAILGKIMVRTGLSPLAKHIYFLSNQVYVSKAGKLYKAFHDEKRPLHRIETRPATDEERKQMGTSHDTPSDRTNFEHVWRADVYTLGKGNETIVEDDSGEPRFLKPSEILIGSGWGTADSHNVGLYGVEKDPFRLCSGMAETRAISRALTTIYDFQGMESLEEVAMAATPPIPVEEPKATVSEKSAEKPEDATRQLKEAELIEEIHGLLDRNARLLAAEYAKLKGKFTQARLKEYTLDGLVATRDAIQDKINKLTPDGETPEAPPSEGDNS